MTQFYLHSPLEVVKIQYNTIFNPNPVNPNPKDAFHSLSENATLLLPDETTVNLYKANESWSKAFKFIQVARNSARVFAEFGQEATSLKFHYSDLYDGTAPNAIILDDIPSNFRMEYEVRDKLAPYFADKVSPHYQIKSIDFAPSFYATTSQPIVNVCFQGAKA